MSRIGNILSYSSLFSDARERLNRARGRGKTPITAEEVDERAKKESKQVKYLKTTEKNLREAILSAADQGQTYIDLFTVDKESISREFVSKSPERKIPERKNSSFVSYEFPDFNPAIESFCESLEASGFTVVAYANSPYDWTLKYTLRVYIEPNVFIAEEHKFSYRKSKNIAEKEENARLAQEAVARTRALMQLPN